MPVGELLYRFAGAPPPLDVVDRPVIGYFALDALLWWLKPGAVSVPLLTTTRRPVDLARADTSLRNPNVAVLFGNQDVSYPPFEGFRFTAGFYPAIVGEPGAELGGFYLPRRTTTFNFTSGGSAALILPFVNTTSRPPVQAGTPVAGILDGLAVPGNVTISSSAQLWSAEVGPTMRLWQGDALGVDVLAGFRHVGLREDLKILAQSINGPETFQTFDRFVAKNYFFGAQGGARLSWAWGSFGADLTGKVAAGVEAENVEVTGSTLRPASAVSKFKGPTQVAGGFFSFAQQGIVKNTRFAVIPELGLNLGWRLTEFLTLRAGYGALYWSSVVVPGEQVNPRFSRRTLPLFGGDPSKAPAPTGEGKETDFWAHGLNVGLDIEF
jgi:hypothetical protein